MSYSNKEIINLLYDFHATQYGFASGVLGASKDISDAIKKPDLVILYRLQRPLYLSSVDLLLLQ